MRKGRKCPKCGYEKNAADAGWCGLCYEPFRKAAGAAADAAPPPPITPVRTFPAAKPLLLLAAALLGTAAAVWEFKARRETLPGNAPAENRFAAKTAEAERLLETHLKEQAAFLAGIESGEPDPDGFGAEGQYTKKLFKMEDAYSNALNALELPPPDRVDKVRDATYIAWTQAHQLREETAMNEFNARYGRLAMKAAALPR